MASASAQVLASGTAGPLAMTEGSSPGTSLPIGATLYLQITADELEGAELEVTATVVRIDPARPAGRIGHGCRFEALYSGHLAD